MATLLIDQLIKQTITITKTEYYDIVLLPEAYGITTSGRVIGAFGASDSAAFDDEIESYSLVLGKADAVLTIGGNYRQNEEYDIDPTEISLGHDTGEWEYDFSSTYTTAIDANYNVYHLQFNDGYASGAIKFKGSDAKLVLTAQNGAGNANFYSNAENGSADLLKTDDGIAIRSDNYGIYAEFDVIYATSDTPAAPNKLVENHTITADEKLTISSDLVGTIESNVAALQLGYKAKDGDKIKVADNGSGNTVVGSGIKAGTLQLDSNFRAEITVLNTKDTLNMALCGDAADDDRAVIYESSVVDSTVVISDEGESVTGTTIAAVFSDFNASNNTVSNAGIWAVESLATAEDSIWAGEIIAKTNDVSIIASEVYQESDAGDVVSASDNDISAYGIRSEGNVTIASMGSLVKDYDGVNTPEIQHGSISVQANNNLIVAQAKGKPSDKGIGAATANAANNVIQAAGIKAGSLTLGKVTSDVTISVEADNNNFVVHASGNAESVVNTSGSSVLAYGICASSAALTDFNGNISVSADNFIFDLQKAGNTIYTPDFDKYGAFGIYVSGDLTAAGKLGGDIDVSATTELYGGMIVYNGAAIGIYASTITVDGVIASDITAPDYGYGEYIQGATSFGIYAYNLSVDAFVGKIKADHGLNIVNGISGSNEDDRLDIAGELNTSISGISSLGEVNVRVSGKIVGSKYAIRSELSYNPSGRTSQVQEIKYDDSVEIVQGAVIKGNIELGAGMNTVIISSDADVDGFIFSEAGRVNIFFNLEETSNSNAALYIDQTGDEIETEDKTLLDSNTITVNLNYANVGTYKLIEYGYSDDTYAKLYECWDCDRLVAFSYQGNEVTVKLESNGNGGFVGKAEIKGKDGSLLAKATANFDFANGKAGLTVTVEEIADLVADLWSLENTDSYVTQEYDAEKRTLTLDWSSADTQIKADDFGLENIALYEVEYILMDENGKALGASASTRLEGFATNCVIKGVDNNTQVQWRMRLLGSSDDKVVTNWSDWYTVGNVAEEGKVNTYVEVDNSFDCENINTYVIDNDLRANTVGVVGATATLNWDKIESGNTVRYYVVEYCTLTDQITLEDAYANGFESLEDYIANGLEMKYTKVVTGTSVVLSKLQNESYLYWKIHAVDVYGNESDYVAGNTARVWTFNDTEVPTFSEGKKGAGYVVSLDLPAADAELTEMPELKGAIGWNAASDDGSGIRHYVIEYSTDGGETYEMWKTVQSEDLVTKSFGSWTTSNLDSDKTYRVMVNGEESLIASVSVELLGSEEVYTLNWIGMGDFAGSVATVQYMDENGEWQTVATLDKGGYTFTAYDYTIDLDGLSGSQYKFRVQALDYYGHGSVKLETENIVLDNKAPTFTNDKCEVALDINDKNPEHVTLKPTFSWYEAEDYVSDQGVRYYEVLFRAQGEEGSEGEWIYGGVFMPADAQDGKFTFTYNKALTAQVYEYKVVVYDYFGRTDEITGTFGSVDMAPPVGSFDDDSFKATVTATYEPIYQEITDPENSNTYPGVSGNTGNTGSSSNGNLSAGTGNGNDDLTGDDSGSGSESGEVEPEAKQELIGYKVIDATVTLDWSDTFSDVSGVLYKITVSGDKNCTAGDQTYEFWTSVDSGSTFTFDNSTPGCPVGIFQNMKTVYWYVEVYDGNYNKASESSVINSFEFKAEHGKVASGEKPATPVILQINQDKMENDCHTDEIGLAWSTEKSWLGIYSYTIELQDKKGNVVYSGSTVDLSDKLGTDLNPQVSVVDDGERNIMVIENLRKFFGKSALADGTYKVVVTSVDATGKTSKSKAMEFVLDTTRPAAVNVTEAAAVANKRNGTEYSTLIIKWDAVEDVSGIDYYEVSYRKKSGLENSEYSWTVKKVSGTEYSMDVNPLDPDYEFRVVAVDKAGNRGVEWSSDTVETISPVVDGYADTLQSATALKFDANNRLVVADAVGRGDKADVFKVDISDKTAAVSMTVNELTALLGNNQTIRINVYEGNNLTKVWKSFTVKNEARVFSDLLFKANTSYTFEVVGSGDNATQFEITLDKTDLAIDNSDDTLALAQTNGKVLAMPTAGNTLIYKDFVGFGDSADCQIIEQAASGEYTFNLSNVSANTVMTVYEVQGDGKKPVAIATVKADGSKVNGVSSPVLVLDKDKSYYVEVKPGNVNAYGSDYELSIDCVKNFRVEDIAAAKADNLAKSNIDALELDGDVIEGVVGGSDTVDYIKFTVEQAGAYTIKLDNTNGKAISAALGYIDDNGNFKSLLKVAGTAGSDSLTLSREFTDLEMGRYGTRDFFVQITSVGKGTFSDYDAAFVKNSNIAGFNNSDDKILTAKQAATDSTVYTYGNLTAGAVENNWVGMGDAEDYWQLDLGSGNSGIYDIAVSGAENPVKVTLYQAVYDANGNIASYKALKSAALTIGKNSSVEFAGMLLDENAEYYVGVTATGSKKGQNSDYTISMTQQSTAVALGNIDGDEVYSNTVAGVELTAAGTSWVVTAPADGGAYNVSLNAEDVEGSAKLTVYELLENGSKRVVKSVTVKGGNAGESGVLTIASDMVKNGTGIYQIEVKGANAKSSGSFDLTLDGYEFAKYIAEKDNAITAGVKDWVGMGDAADSYAFNVTTAGVYSIDLADFAGGNIKLAIVDAYGKTVKSFTTAANSSEASYSYNFAKGNYMIVVSSADNGKKKFSEYTMEIPVARVEDIKKADNSFKNLYENELTTGVAVDSANGWVGLQDAQDYYKLKVTASGNYELALGDIVNDAKVTVYEVTAFYADGSVKSAKAIGSTTAKAANASGVIGNLNLDAAKEYYVMVQSTAANGTKDTEYAWELNSMTELTDGYNAIDSVGYGDMADYYQFTAQDDAAAKISLNSASAVMTLYKVENGKYKKVSTFTASEKMSEISTGDLCLEAGAQYVVEVTAPKVAAGKDSDYQISFENYDLAGFATADNTTAAAGNLLLGNKVSSAVWADDAVDCYRVEVGADGSFSLDMSEINGKNVKLSILNAAGKTVKTLSGAANSDTLHMVTDLAAGTYYLKVESTGKGTASKYELEMTRNEDRAGFSNADDKWSQVAADADAVSYDFGDTLNNWLGYGDAVDTFKITLSDNGVVSFGAGDIETAEALIDKDITLSLVDTNGKAISLVFDAENGIYTTKTVLAADVDYFLSAKNSKEKTLDTDYSITIGN